MMTPLNNGGLCFCELVKAVSDVPAFAEMLPLADGPERTWLGRIVAAWIDPRTARDLAACPVHLDRKGPVEFDIGFRRPVTASSLQAAERVFVDLLREIAEGISLPAAALTALARFAPNKYSIECVREQNKLDFQVTHLALSSRSLPELFVRIGTSEGNRRWLEPPLFMLCTELTAAVEQRAEEGELSNAVFENHGVNLFDAYLQATLLELLGSPSRAGLDPGEGLGMSVNLQFLREIVVMSRLPLAGADIDALRTSAYANAARQFRR